MPLKFTRLSLFVSLLFFLTSRTFFGNFIFKLELKVFSNILSSSKTFLKSYFSKSIFFEAVQNFEFLFKEQLEKITPIRKKIKNLFT